LEAPLLVIVAMHSVTQGFTSTAATSRFASGGLSTGLRQPPARWIVRSARGSRFPANEVSGKVIPSAAIRMAAGKLRCWLQKTRRR